MAGELLGLENWTNFQAAGGARVATGGFLDFPPSISAAFTLDADDQLTFDYPETGASAASLIEGRVVRLTFDTDPVMEWYVERIVKQAGNPLFQVRCASVRRVLLNYLMKDVHADGWVFFNQPAIRQLPSVVLSSYLLVQGPAWMVAGTVTPTDRVDLEFVNDTVGSCLRRLEEATGYEAEFVFGAAQYTVNLVRRGATAAKVVLRGSKNIVALQQDDRPSERITRITGYGNNGASIAEAWHRVGAVNGTRIGLVPIHGGTLPIQYDDQLNHAGLEGGANSLYLEKKDGTYTQITDSFASDSAVQVASASGIAVDDWVCVRASSAGKHFVDLDSPAAIVALGGAPGGIRRGKVETQWGRAVNILRNGIPESWPATDPDNWTVVGTGWSKETGAGNHLFAGQSLKGTGITSAKSVTLTRTGWQVRAREQPYSASVWVRITSMTPGTDPTADGLLFTALGKSTSYVSPINSWLLLTIENVTIPTGSQNLSAAISAGPGATWTGYIAGFQINPGPRAEPMLQGSAAARIWELCMDGLLARAGNYRAYSGTIADLRRLGYEDQPIVLGGDAILDDDILGQE